ncbi:MAG: Ig-like domain-containing protein [Verrucomicrobiota bacterium]|nr:Ig-like domain-containing protein [Verrucomicrobiota bacterium]
MKFSKVGTITSLLGLLLSSTIPCSSLNGYEPPHNWQLRTHPNGEYYNLYIPDGIEEGKVYPVVLGLHGCCWDNQVPVDPPRDPMFAAFHGFNSNVQSEPTFIIAPYSASSWINKSDKVMAILTDIRAEFPIDPQRIILTGFSMGGAGGIQYLNKYPNTFAGAILVAVALGDPGLFDSANFRNVPIWGGVGLSDGWKAQMDPVFAKIRAANGYPNTPSPELFGLLPRYSYFLGVGHGDCMEALFGQPEVISWAYALRKDGNAMPMVQFTAPSPGAEAILPEGTTSITLSADAVDPDGIIRNAEIFLDGVSLGTFTAPPYQVAVSNLAPGLHTAKVTVIDNGIATGHAVDKVNEDRRTFYVHTTLQFPTEQVVPVARAGEFYNYQIKVDGINGLDTWSQDGGQKLPPGFMLTTGGAVRGVTSSVGDYTFTARVVDANATAVAKKITIKVIPARPKQPLLSGITVKGRSTVQPWRFAVGEPWGTSGYGNPPGAYKRDTHPYFDGILGTDAINGAYFLRIFDNGVGTNSTGADWITFTTDLPIRVNIAYMQTKSGQVPAWLAEQQFTATGKEIKTYFRNFDVYAKDFPAGTVSLSGNEGLTTGADTHYLIIIEPLQTAPAEYPWPVTSWKGGSADLVSMWMGEGYVNREAYPWFNHSDHGWLYVFGETSDSIWWFTQPNQFWWTSESVYPWIYRWSSGWWYYMEGSRNPAWYYDFSAGEAGAWVNSLQ